MVGLPLGVEVATGPKGNSLLLYLAIFLFNDVFGTIGMRGDLYKLYGNRLERVSIPVANKRQP